jgi:hypothetical protein
MSARVLPCERGSRYRRCSSVVECGCRRSWVVGGGWWNDLGDCLLCSFSLTEQAKFEQKEPKMVRQAQPAGLCSLAVNGLRAHPRPPRFLFLLQVVAVRLAVWSLSPPIVHFVDECGWKSRTIQGPDMLYARFFPEGVRATHLYGHSQDRRIEIWRTRFFIRIVSDRIPPPSVLPDWPGDSGRRPLTSSGTLQPSTLTSQ